MIVCNLQRTKDTVQVLGSFVLSVYPFVGRMPLLQIRYSLVVILELKSVSEVQYKEIMIINNE